MTEERTAAFWRKVDRCGEHWIWHGMTVYGGGMFRPWGDRRCVMARRVAWALAHGLTLDELDGVEVRSTCGEPMCVNPGHHYARARNGATHCLNGHEYADGNEYVSPSGVRHCRECKRVFERSRSRTSRRTKRRMDFRSCRQAVCCLRSGGPCGNEG